MGADEKITDAFSRFQSHANLGQSDEQPQAAPGAEQQAPGAYDPNDLTRVPGVVGAMVDWFEQSSMYPSRRMALGAALAVAGTILGQRVRGPTGTATHLNIALLGPTTRGKAGIISGSKRMLKSAGATDRLGPSDFGSSTAFIETLYIKPVFLSLVDEFGDKLHRITKPNSGGYESDLMSIIKELFSIEFELYLSPAKAGKPSRDIFAPSPSIVGFSIPERFFNALRGADIAGGFVNRFLAIEDQEFSPENTSHTEHSQVPRALGQALEGLYRPIDVKDRNVDFSFDPPIQMRWGPNARQVYDEFGKSLRTDPDIARRNVFGRAKEKACKAASIVASMDGRTVVELADFNWAKAFVLECDETLLAGIKKFGLDPQEFANLCRLILDFLKKGPDRSVTRRIFKRKFTTLIKSGKDLTGALQHLEECGCIKCFIRTTGGRSSEVIQWLADLTDEVDDAA